MTLILCGYKGCGKTTIGRAYSNAFSARFIDTDSLIIDSFPTTEDKVNSIPTIYHKLGPSAFREVEAQLIQSIRPSKNTLIATGGGALMDENNVKHLKSLGKLIYLYVNKEVLYQRLLTSPCLPRFIDEKNKERSLKNYLISRETIYPRLADCTLDTNGKNIQEIIDRIRIWIK